MLKLYFAPGTCALASRIALEEAGADYEAVSELVAPVIGSTLTTVVVFAPLGLLSGVVGQFFRALSITLSVSVILSLFLALTLIPLLARWTRPEDPHKGRGDWLEERYARVLHRSMDHPRLLGVGVSGLGAPVRQLGLWDVDTEKARRVQEVVDELQAKFGRDSIQRGSVEK